MCLPIVLNQKKYFEGKKGNIVHQNINTKRQKNEGKSERSSVCSHNVLQVPADLRQLCFTSPFLVISVLLLLFISSE